MKRNEMLAVIIMLIATVGTVIGIFAVEKYRRSKFYTVELIAREPDNGNWYPRTITVQRGQQVKILIRNIETVSHGFALPDFNVSVREIKAGNVKTVTFTPDKVGSFPFLCTVWCSPRHQEMTGTLIVE
jgi:cytochrome c oxidase subunit 2